MRIKEEKAEVLQQAIYSRDDEILGLDFVFVG